MQLKPILRKMSLAFAMAVGLGSAQAGVLTFQDVVFTSSWTGNVLTLEIDAAKRSGNWSGASLLGALSLKDIGSFSSVSMVAAPNGVGAWQLNSKELNAKGCAGGGATKSNTALCLSGAPIALTDNMVFSFAFSGGTPELDAPHLKVNFMDSAQNKVGDLLSQTVKSTPTVPTVPVVTPPVVVAPPVVVTPPVTQPVSDGTTVSAGDEVTGTTPPVPPPVLVQPPVVALPPVAGNNEVPEPYSIALLLGGLALMGVVLRKRG